MYVKHTYHPHPLPDCEEAQGFARFLKWDAPRVLSEDVKKLPPLALVDEALFAFTGGDVDEYQELIEKFFRPARRDLILRLELQDRSDEAEAIWQKEADECLLPFVCLYHRLQAQS